MIWGYPHFRKPPYSFKARSWLSFLVLSPPPVHLDDRSQHHARPHTPEAHGLSICKIWRSIRNNPDIAWIWDFRKPTTISIWYLYCHNTWYLDLKITHFIQSFHPFRGSVVPACWRCTPRWHSQSLRSQRWRVSNMAWSKRKSWEDLHETSWNPMVSANSWV